MTPAPDQNHATKDTAELGQAGFPRFVLCVSISETDMNDMNDMGLQSGPYSAIRGVKRHVICVSHVSFHVRNIYTTRQHSIYTLSHKRINMTYYRHTMIVTMPIELHAAFRAAATRAGKKELAPLIRDMVTAYIASQEARQNDTTPKRT